MTTPPQKQESAVSDQPSLNNIDSFDDNISVTSTAYPDESEDKEYEVEDILAEEVDFEGVLKYLVRWKSYPMEMCTWEPTQNFTPELLEDIWEQKKRRPDYVPFDRSLYDEAYRAKTLRHIRRNNKRRRMGLPETSPFLEPTLTYDNDVSDNELFVPAAPSIVVEGDGTLTSPALPTTEIIDSDDDIEVIEELSAPPQEKKKKKKRVVANDDESALPLKKKKKAKDSKDGTPKTDKEKKDRKAKEGDKDTVERREKNGRKEKEEDSNKASSKEKSDKKGKVDDKTRGNKEVEKLTSKSAKSTGKLTDKCTETPTKPGTGDKKKKTQALEAVPTKDKAKSVSGSLDLRRNGLPACSSRSSASSGSVSDRDADGKAPAKKASIDKGAALTKAKPTSSNGSTSASVSHSRTRSGSGSASTYTPISAPARTSSLPSLTEAAPAPPKPAATAANSPRKSSISQDGGNAFSGGKRARPGRSFDAAMKDPSSTPQLFGNYSLLRRAELNERDKADNKPLESSQLKLGLFPIGAGPPPGPPPNTATSTAAANQKPSEEAPEKNPEEAPLRSSLKRSESGPRRKKSVRFPDNDGSDAGLLLGRTRLKSPPVPRSDNADPMDIDEDVPMDISLDEAHYTQPAAPSISLPPAPVKLLFGTQAEPLDAILHVQAESGVSEGLLGRIIAGKAIRFERSFLAATFMQQVRGITQENLFSGRITASSHILDTVAQRLKLMASGLIHVLPEYAMVVYPAQCDEWSEAMFGFPPPVGEDATAPLRFVVVRTNVDCSELLRPVESPDTNYDWLSGDQDRQQVMGHFHGLSRDSFRDLLPDERPSKSGRIIFLLAFPPTAKPFMWQMALWLREMRSDCEVLFSTQPGAWMSFMWEVEKENHSGVVIVHELATDAVRRFPYFRRLVAPGRWNARIWSISQGTYESPIFHPIFTADSDKGKEKQTSDELLPIGRVSWTELFPRGLALLLTPSVILADPMLVYHLLRWVCAAARSGKAPVTLVAAHDLRSELKQVADDKLEMLTEIMNGAGPDQSKADMLRTAQRVGAAERHCVYRHESWVLADELCDSGTQEMISSMRGDGWPYSVVLADPHIDANDEQSLVNWFGWWSTIHMDQYRSFYVVGSENKGAHLDIMSRKVKIPDFVDTALDTAMVTTAPPETSVPKPAPAPAKPMYEKLRKVPTEPPAQPAVDDPRRPSRTNSTSSAVQAPSTVSEQRHPTVPVSTLSSRLLAMNKSKNFWKAYGYVVWWRDSSEAYRNGCLNSDKHTVRDWMKYSWPFSPVHRSYVGMFNLADDPLASSASHPFVVVWRPVMPHLKLAQKETELIFWDPHASSRVRGRSELTEGVDLTPGQRAVVDYIRRHGGDQNPGMYLSRVWLSTRTQSFNPATWNASNTEAETALDDEAAMQACVNYLDKLANDFQYVMPPTGNYLANLEYRLVVTDSESVGTSEVVVEAAPVGAPPAAAPPPPPKATPKATPVTTPITAKDNDKAKNNQKTVRERMVFHPPRGTSANHIRNSLYDAAHAARRLDPAATTMHYTFRPTLEWYREQDDEGSGFEHVHVETAAEVCRIFGISTTRDY